MSMFIFHVLLLFIAITNSVFLRKDDLTFELIDQPNQINDPTTGITENEVLPDDSLPFFTDDPRGSSPIPEHSDNDPFGIADLPDPADQLLTLGDPASTPVESLFAEAGCSTHRTSSDMRRRFKWSREDGSEAPAVCKPQPIEENSPEPAKKTPIRGPDGEQCRDKKVPYCCDIDGLSRLTQTPPIYGEWGYAREYCIPCKLRCFSLLQNPPKLRVNGKLIHFLRHSHTQSH